MTEQDGGEAGSEPRSQPPQPPQPPQPLQPPQPPQPLQPPQPPQHPHPHQHLQHLHTPHARWPAHPAWPHAPGRHRPPPPHWSPPWGAHWPPQPRPLARLPWPVVLLVAVVTGLVGGVVGAVSVGTSAPTPTVPVVGSAPAPLPKGGSIAGVANATLPSVVQITSDSGGVEATGSGFILDRSGHVVTNNHVIEGVSTGGRIMVAFDDETRVRASVVGRSPAYDIAVLQISDPARHRPAAHADLRRLRVGDTVVAIGAPLGLSSSVTSGIVSALNRPVTVGGEGEVSYLNAIQTDAAINPGNSGGPLVNLHGEVIGVNSAIATLGGPFGGGTGSIGVGFAIPIDQVLRTADQILESGEASYPVIGAAVSVDSQGNGARVIDVTPGGPADSAGLEEGDRVTRIDGQVIEDGIELIVAIRSRVPGETIRLVYHRDGGTDTADVGLDERVG